MKTKASLYAVIGGCVGAVLTMAVCSVLPLGAQSQQDAVFGKITCEELEVGGFIGRVTISDAMIHVKSALPSDRIRGSILEGSSGATLIVGGSILISGDDGIALVDIRNDGHSGSVSVARREMDTIAATIGANENGGYVSVHDYEKQGGTALMTISEHGGLVSVSDKDGSKGKAAMGMSEFGNGVVNTWDKNGNRLASLK